MYFLRQFFKLFQDTFQDGMPRKTPLDTIFAEKNIRDIWRNSVSYSKKKKTSGRISGKILRANSERIFKRMFAEIEDEGTGGVP